METVGKEKYFFCAGLPRAGSTLLMNILAQNPRFHCTATSGLVEVLMMIKNQWMQFEPHRAIPTPQENEDTKVRTLRAAFEGYHDTDAPVVLDKSRGWLSELEMAKRVLGKRPLKVLVPVRDMREVLCSFEGVYRRSKDAIQVPQERAAYFKFQTMEGRFSKLNQEDQPVGIAYNRIKDAIARGFRENMHFVDFDKLTKNPGREIQEVYRFLEEEPCIHDFEKVDQVTHENDAAYGWRNLHKIQPKISTVERKWPEFSQHLKVPMRTAIEADSKFWKEWI